jgi:hypothetical protein
VIDPVPEVLAPVRVIPSYLALRVSVRRLNGVLNALFVLLFLCLSFFSFENYRASRTT